MLKSNKIRCHLFIFLSLLVSITCAATPASTSPAKTYRVEIIAFKNNDTPENTETFPNYPALPEYKNALELLASDETLTNYMMLPRDQLTLNRDENLIQKKERYELLFHYGWLQQQNEEFTVHLQSDLSDSAQLEGTIKIKRGYYYNVALNLDLQPKTIGPKQHFVLSTKRNLKNKEMHFIDHPKFGVILQITTL